MGSSNLDNYHRHQQQVFHNSSFTAPQPFQVHGDDHQQWNQNFFLSCGGFIPNFNGIFSSPNDFMPTLDELSVSPPFNSDEMVQEIGFHLACNAESFVNQVPASRLLARINEEQPDYFSKLTQVINDTSLTEGYYLDKFHLRTLPSECQISGASLFSEPGSLASCEGGRGNFSMFFPTDNVLNIKPYRSSISGSFGMDLQALDLLATTKLGRSFCQTSLEDATLLLEDSRLGQLHETLLGPSYRMPSLVRGATEAQRTISTLEHRSHQTTPKRHRLEQRSTFSSFKVRKEKLGDRIAALQQLVAPFGKTDTASVLMEAIGYIKFLQEQVQTLSGPYMRSAVRKKQKRVHAQETSSEEASEPKLDLRSRGLCLVPLSCTAYVTSETGGVWSPSNYRGFG